MNTTCHDKTHPIRAWLVMGVVSSILAVQALPVVGQTATNSPAAKEIEARVRAWMPPVVAEGSGVFQYAVPVEGSQTTAYLWIPADAERIRGLIMGGDLMMEANFIVDPLIRNACAEQSLGILFFMKGGINSFTWQKGQNDARFTQVLENLARTSNHPELTESLLLPIGHSAASTTPALILHWNPERCLGAITYKGAHAIATDRDTAPVRGIPTLHIQDFVEEYKDRRETGSIGRVNVAAIRAKDPLLLSGIVEDNGSKHPAWCFRLTPVIAEFIRATAAARLGPDGKVRVVPPAAGALVDDHFVAPRHPTAPAAEYKGDPKEAMWYPSLKLAQMITDYNAVQLGKKAQYIAFLDGATPRFVGPDVFELKAQFLEKTDNPGLPQDPTGHAEGPILFAAHGRRTELVGPGRFRLNFHPLAVRWYRVSAYSMGDATYRFEENLVTLNVPKAGGAAQTIDFPEIGMVQRTDFPLALKATSSASLPVRFTVEYGPAVVEGADRLVLAELPKRARFPMTIAVWAYQCGSYVDPKTQSAEPVRRLVTVTENK